MINGFGNTSYSDKKISFLDRDLVIRYFHCFYEVSNSVNIIAIMFWYGFVTRMSLCVQSLLVLREVSYSLEVLKSLEEANNEANTTFLRVFNI